jgi:hypothetical protein
MTFWYGSGCGFGSSNSYISLTDPYAEPGDSKTYRSGTPVHLHHSSKIKRHKEVTKQYQEIMAFLTIFA